MKIRDLLQTELWSKRTTWLLLAGVVALIGLGQLGWYTLERFYISPAERDAAREALGEIDRLQASGSLTDEAFATVARLAEVKIRSADRLGWTDRDIGVNFLLSDYLNAIRVGRILQRKQEASGPLRAGSGKSTEQWQARMQKAQADHRSKLHGLLD
jgi:hypothetical protein